MPIGILLFDVEGGHIRVTSCWWLGYRTRNKLRFVLTTGATHVAVEAQSTRWFRETHDASFELQNYRFLAKL